MRKAILFWAVPVLVIIFGILATLYASNDIIKALGAYLSIVGTIYLFAILTLFVYSKYRLNKDLEVQYFMGVVSGLVSGILILAANNLLKPESNPIKLVLCLIAYMGVLIFTVSFGLLVVASNIQKRE